MPATSIALTAPEADRLAEIHADAADQFLISYLTLTRFPEGNVYALSFLLAHCLELSIKTIFCKKLRRQPPSGQQGHLIENLIAPLPYDIRSELENYLPFPNIRARSRDELHDKLARPTLAFLDWFFELNPNFNDEEWTLLYAMFFVVDLKYGVDTRRRSVQPMVGIVPRLNKRALGLFGATREYFPNKERHRSFLQDFVNKLPEEYNIVRELSKIGTDETPQDTPDYMLGKSASSNFSVQI
jgi:hypothetical protein